MKLKLLALSSMLVVTPLAGVVSAQTKVDTPVTTCVSAPLSSDSTVGDLLDNAAAKAILIKHIPSLKDNDQIDMARSMSLRSLQTYAPDKFTDDVLKAIDADLAKLPKCKT